MGCSGEETLCSFAAPLRSSTLIYEVGPKNNRNLNVARELEVVVRYAARCHEPRQYSSSLSLGVDLGWLLLLFWLFF
jgi:hypothetical protein